MNRHGFSLRFWFKQNATATTTLQVTCDGLEQRSLQLLSLCIFTKARIGGKERISSLAVRMNIEDGEIDCRIITVSRKELKYHYSFTQSS